MTKIKIFAGFAVAAIALAFMFQFFDPKSPSVNMRDKVNVILKVNWIPIRRMEPIAMNYSIDGKPIWNGALNESPWMESIIVKRGSTITLVAWQAHRTDWSMFCTIEVNGVKSGPNPSANNPDGSSSCAATAVA